MDDTDATDLQAVTNPSPTNSSVQTRLDELIVGRRVRVEAKDGKRFEGDLTALSLDERHVFLHDVEELPGGATAPSAFVAAVDWIVPVDDESA